MARGSNPIKLLFVLLLGGSLGLKLWLGSAAMHIDDRTLAADLAAAMRAQHFTVTVEQRPIGRVLHASRGPCRMMLRNGDDEAFFRDAFARNGASYGAVSFVSGGVSMARPPWPRAKIAAFAQSQAAALGIRTERPAFIAVARNPGCGNFLPTLGDITVRWTDRP